MVGWGVSSSVRSTISVYFNTVRRAVYYVLYVLIFITISIYNTVFFIIYPWNVLTPHDTWPDEVLK